MQTNHGQRWRASQAVIALAISGTWLTQGLVAHAAEGGEAKRVLLVKTQRFEEVGSIVASRVDKALGTALALESRVELVLPDGLDDAAPAAPVAAPVTDETLLKAGKLVEDAKGQFSKSKFMDAVKTFKKAMALFEKKLALLENFDLYVDAQLGKALAYFAAGYDDNGEDELGKVLTLRPTLVLDKRRVPKAATDALARLQLLYAKAIASPITVDSNASGPASVYVDGVLAGVAPVTLDKLLRGRHWLRVVADGYEPWADSVEASAKERTVTAKLKAVRRAAGAPVAAAATTPAALAEAARTGSFGKTFDAGAASLCSKYGLTGIILTYVTKAPDGYRLAGFYFDARSGKLSEVDGVRLDPELFDLQVNALTLSEHLVGAASGFPTKVSITTTPDIYKAAEMQAAAAKAEAAKAEAARAEAARIEAANAEAARADAAKAEAARADAAKAEAARAEAARAEAAKAEAARAQAAKAEAARAEALRIEAARAEAARAEAARLEAARAEATRAEARAAAAKAEAERAAEAARVEAAKADAARAEAARIEAGRSDTNADDAAAREARARAEAEALRAEALREEADRQAAARAAAAREAAAKAEAAKAGTGRPNTVLTRDPDKVANGGTAGSGGNGTVGAGVHKKLPPVVVDDDEEFYETWWFWTIVTGVVVGGGAATYFALSDSGGGAPSGFRSTVTF